MKIPIYQIDAFTNNRFSGNPAMVCPLEEWLSDDILQSIATENNIPVTAFLVPSEPDYQIRWFTPVIEENICGHATLAAAYLLFDLLRYEGDEITFKSKSGPITVKRRGDGFMMDFPALIPRACDIPEKIRQAFNITPSQCLRSEDYILVFETEDEVRAAQPDLDKLADIDLRGVVITASSSSCDFVVRFFTPKFGIPEDAVTGSAYVQLAPYWSEKMGVTRFHARQLSPRGGNLYCELIDNERVLITGKAVKFLQGEIEV